MSNHFQALIENRRTIYAIGKNVKQSTDELVEIIENAIVHAPSAFNSQTSRAVLLFGSEHTAFWNMVFDKLKEFLGVIADSKTFILNTGQEISKSELNKIDYSGSNSNEKREVWDYGEVYLLAEEGTIAVEINNEFRIARIE